MFDRVEKRDVPILDMIDVKSPHHRENKTCVRAAHGLVQRSNSSTDTGRGLFYCTPHLYSCDSLKDQNLPPLHLSTKTPPQVGRGV